MPIMSRFDVTSNINTKNGSLICLAKSLYKENGKHKYLFIFLKARKF